MLVLKKPIGWGYMLAVGWGTAPPPQQLPCTCCFTKKKKGWFKKKPMGWGYMLV